MRFMVKVSIPVEAGNAEAKNGFQRMRAILEEQQPEAAYFIAENGTLTAVLILEMDEACELPSVAEPWFLAFNASVEVTPAMLAEDLGMAAPTIEEAVNKYG